jgi:8-oxo-dGTP pyrophosphatase MutT (NUDIX family)
MLIEAAAGLLDDQDPETAVRREAREELGVTIGELEHVYDVYMSPGSVTERLHFYAAPYTPSTRTAAAAGSPTKARTSTFSNSPTTPRSP